VPTDSPRRRRHTVPSFFRLLLASWCVCFIIIIITVIVITIITIVIIAIMPLVLLS